MNRNASDEVKDNAMSNKKTIIMVVGIAVSVLVVILLISLPFALGRYRLYSENCWAETEIALINTRADDPAWVAKEFRSLKWQNKWVSPNMIIMENEMWLIYSNACGKDGWQMGPITIARASNGKWYRTQSHFCENGCENGMTEEPADSLLTFINRYGLTEFDGKPKVRFFDKWR